jgi:hypothetical protein
LLATLKEVQAIEQLEFTAEASSSAAAAAAAPVEMEIDWGDLVVVDDAAPAATDATNYASGGSGAGCDALDIDWNVVSSEEGAASGGGEISWDIDFVAGEEGAGDYAVAGGDDVYGISIAQVIVFKRTVKLCSFSMMWCSGRGGGPGECV